jgi:hypothetical protein
MKKDSPSPKPQGKKVRFIKPPNTLKLKAGNGGIAEENIERAQTTMDTFESDFQPDAQRFLDQLSAALKMIESALASGKSFDPDSAIFPMMQIKANGGMFKFRLMSDVADIGLQFMEAIEKFNPDSLEIMHAHENALRVILKNNLRGDGGKEGYKLVQELHRACTRYFRKYAP